ncbi:hypothetical protein [Vibrio sp. TBV020]|uniref:hypothetical protein n=1 Tax=Vibrio sp. TBV020 TaxID=3137398 RepID=UPI0038CDA35F
MIVSKPVRSNEPDLLIGHEHQPLRIVNLQGELVAQYCASVSGWTHDALECVDYFSVSPDGWDAYLSDQWIGSSEV